MRRTSTWLCAALLLAPTAASAQEACEPLDEQDFRGLLLQLQAGIDRGDLELSKDVLNAVDAGLPCLTFAPEPRRWADLLMGEAVVRFAEGQDWEPALTTALRIYPAVDRGVSSQHPLATWEPPSATPPLQVTEVGEGIYVDGLPAEKLPPSGEVHLVQRTDGRFWNTYRTGPNEPLPAGWEAQEVVQPPRVISWGAVGLGLGIASIDQTPDFGSDWTPTIAPGGRTAPALTVHTQGQATFYSAFGVYGRASAWSWSQSPGIDAQVAGIVNWKALTFGLGAGTGSVEIVQGPEIPVVLDEEEVGETTDRFLPRYVLSMLHLRGGDDTTWHVGLSYGRLASTQRGLLEAHLAPNPDNSGRWRVGATLEWIRSGVVEQGRPRATADVGSVRSALHVGRVFGEY